MGFLSKLFGGDGEPESNKADGKSSPTQPPAGRSSTKPASKDESPTADVSPAAKRAAALAKETGARSQSHAPQEPVAAQRPSVPGSTSYKPAKGGDDDQITKKVRGVQPPPSSDTGQAREERRKSPGFYSVSPSQHPEIVRPPGTLSPKSTMVGLAPPAVGRTRRAQQTTKKAKPAPREEQRSSSVPAPAPSRAEQKHERQRQEAPEDAAPSVPLEPTSSPSGDVDSLLQEGTNPGVGHCASRHESEVELPPREVSVIAEFIVDLALGPASLSWIPKLKTAVSRLYSVARQHHMDELRKGLDALRLALDGEGPLAGQRREQLLSCFADVRGAIPTPFDIEEQTKLRDRMIVGHLLRQIPGGGESLREELDQKGLCTLASLCSADAETVGRQLSGGPDEAQELLSCVRRYLQHRERRGPELVTVGRDKLLTKQLNKLKAAADDFQVACDSDDAKEKRRARRKRQEQCERLHLLLAEMGEAELLSEISRTSVQGKIDHLSNWLSSRKSG